MDIDFATFQGLIDGQDRNTKTVARFYDKCIRTGEMTKEGTPKFNNTCYIEIRTKDNHDIFDQPATAEHQRRFPQEYMRYQLEKKQTEDGTPLDQFAFITLPQLETCKYRGIFTVEKLAELDEDRAKSICLTAEVEKAKKFLEASKNNLAIDEFTKREQEYKAEIEELKALKSKLELEIESLKEAAAKPKG